MLTLCEKWTDFRREVVAISRSDTADSDGHWSHEQRNTKQARQGSNRRLLYAEGEEFMVVLALDRRAGVRLVQERDTSSSSGPALPEDVEESALVNKLVAPSVPTAADREVHIASAHAVFRTWCRECCIGRGRMHQHRAGGRDIAILAVAIGYGQLNDRHDQLQETKGAPISISKSDRDRLIGAAIVPTNGANENAIDELKNDVSGVALHRFSSGRTLSHLSSS